MHQFFLTIRTISKLANSILSADARLSSMREYRGRASFSYSFLRCFCRGLISTRFSNRLGENLAATLRGLVASILGDRFMKITRMQHTSGFKNEYQI